MKVWAVLHGGASYVIENTATEYSSLTAVRREYQRRKTDRFYPCWGDKYSIEDEYVGYIYLRHREDTTDEYPDRVLVSGPKGGLRIERA